MGQSQIFSKFPSLKIAQVACEAYFEWIDVLEAVDEAKDQFLLVEIGAALGYRGRDAATAAKARGIPYHLVFIEGEPARAEESIHLEMQKNNIPESQYTIFPYCVGSTEQDVMFYISHQGQNLDVRNWFGQRAVFQEDKMIQWLPTVYMGRQVGRTMQGYDAVMVRQKKLSDLLNLVRQPIIDICDFDIQGSEAEVIDESLAILNNRVKRLHIGTHSHKIEATLRSLLKKNGWRLIRDYPCAQENDTEYGRAKFEDGIQTWLNSRLM
ncbi:MAG: FkbM family methyltransferase [Verrucomicrobia bacterium]|nr:FkbM family methyltransferase [Verrucomicrobiota bacterium]MBU6446777.1 FkbM family methyltransferase [Verrucomicrobiota bacterium]MDE3048241.1 FkbM family methyltransferase [Verrucomicrobiota bacterium]